MKRLLVALTALLSVAVAETLIQKATPKVAAATNPYHGGEAAIRAGEKLYLRECAACHNHGKAPSLRAAEVANATPGALFWVLRNGSLRRGMPSFAHLPEPQRWQIISYLQSEQFATKEH